MATLKQTLVKYAGDTSAPFAGEERITAPMGNEEPVKTSSPMPTQKPFDRTGFLKEIKEIRRSNEIYFYICIAMAILLFVASMVVVFNNLNESGLIKAAVAGFGVTTAGVLSWTFKTLRTKNVIEVLIMMAPEVNDDLLKLIIETLARRL